VLQEENCSDSILTPVKEEVIKPEISIDEEVLIVHNDSLGLDQFFKTYEDLSQCFEICSGDHISII
jgi:hypothetical protein